MSVKQKAKRDPIPENFPSIEAAAEFWDTHDVTDYWDLTKPVKDYSCRIERITYLLTLKPALARKLERVARQRGLSVGAVANQLLREKLNGLAGKPRKRRNRKAAKAP